MTRVRAFFATSLDGMIAGAGDALDWLPGHGEGAEDTFTPFFAEVGAMLMGRRTFDVVSAMEGEWFYGDTPILVATSRALETSIPSVRPVHGPIEAMVEEARKAAGGRDVYLDGGALFRSALEAELIDEITMTLVPVVLGEGIRLFGDGERHTMTLESARSIGAGMVQIRYRV